MREHLVTICIIVLIIMIRNLNDALFSIWDLRTSFSRLNPVNIIKHKDDLFNLN